ncbi:MAG: YwmB family TATA-box binding protein [Lachnospiraceae bacterium]|nr:YwmB family TATA-box binding protein [Lachnospiraceae bacterium]MBP3610241.1 YwmB family TATA-box binding protein [Lachnospiraceae bacterium]
MEQQSAVKRVNVTRWRLLWILIAAAWLFVFLKLLVGALFEKNTSLVAAFSVTNPEAISATVEITARYPEESLTEEQKQQLIGALAEEILLTIEEEPEIIATETRQEMIVSKEAKAASTELKVISLFPEQTDGQKTGISIGAGTRNYLYARISLNESLGTVLTYKNLLEEALRGLSCTEISTTIQLIGDYPGYLTLERRNEITEEILQTLGAEVVYEYREADLYTVYAYTGSLDNYITVEGKKINLHIAMSQNENRYRTILYLASPILPDTW